jgi:adrenodoxin-NADP+ reductase
MLTTRLRPVAGSIATKRSFSTTPSALSRSSSLPSLASRPWRVGVVGGGPAGFYAASRLLSLPGSDKTTVDLFELLPSPFGLARFGVAPDHPEVKVRFFSLPSPPDES